MDLRKSKEINRGFNRICMLCGRIYKAYRKSSRICPKCAKEIKKGQDEQRNWWNQQVNKRKNFQKFIERGDIDGSSELIGDITLSVISRIKNFQDNKEINKGEEGNKNSYFNFIDDAAEYIFLNIKNYLKKDKSKKSSS